jgi:dedicated sortase system histidine kinase
MNLRRQLLLVSLLLLALPWAGCQFINEMEGALRQGQEQSLQATAQAIATVLGQQPSLLYPQDERRSDQSVQGDSIYAPPMALPLIVDGYADGWEEIPAVEFESGSAESSLAGSYRAVTRGDNLYLLLSVRDADPVYEDPGLSREPNGDRVVLRTWLRGRRQEYVIATAAPGSVRARPASRRERDVDPARIRGYWQDAPGGYTVELEIPLSYTGDRLGFYVVDTATRPGRGVATAGNATSLETTAPPWLIYSPRPLQDTLAGFRQPGKQILVVDRHHWLLADASPLDPDTAGSTDTFWLLQLLYRSVLAEDQALAPFPEPPAVGRISGAEIDAALRGTGDSRRYRDPRYSTRTWLSSAAPIGLDGDVIGAVVLRQSAEQYLSLTDQAFSRLLGYSLLALGIGTLGMLGYASLLSWRIRRLSQAARDATEDESSPGAEFPRSRAADEIGELSRRYADLLDKLHGHNEYLRTLSRKLSHELRTPIALIRTSLEHLERTDLQPEEERTYLQRASEGLDRLSRILTAMSEASRLEESLRQNPLETLDLVPLVTELFDAYRTLYRGHRLTLACAVDTAPARVAGDLLVQALDKLVDNAVTFTPPGGEIELSLHDEGDRWALAVSNEGPPLPERLHNRLFEPMVSQREGDDREVHLGLGLHVVKLISDYHGGSVRAGNRDDGCGAIFTLLLPASERKEAPEGPLEIN